jgi:hypothetical protein
MTYLWPGRAPGGSRPTRALRPIAEAALALVVSDLEVNDLDGLHGRTSALLARLTDAARAELLRAVKAVAKDRTALDLSPWTRALARSADRIGCLLCGDPAVAAPIVATLGGPESVDELVVFAVGAEHAAARAAF